jgi:hypothetical protein
LLTRNNASTQGSDTFRVGSASAQSRPFIDALTAAAGNALANKQSKGLLSAESENSNPGSGHYGWCYDDVTVTLTTSTEVAQSTAASILVLAGFAFSGVTVPQYLDRECRCPPNRYRQFNSIIRKELAVPLTAHKIVNESQLCTMIQKDTFRTNSVTALGIEGLTLRDVLRGLDNKMGVYHIWMDEDFCDVHKRQNLECVYIGKGEALTRLLDHAKHPQRLLGDVPYWITFFECKNRVAKYIEQLFLDIYYFPENANENPGTKELWASWTRERCELGTEMHAISNLPNAPQGF